MEHCFQNDSSESFPEVHCAKLDIVAEIWPPSAESKTMTTPSGDSPGEGVSLYALAKRDVANLRFASTEETASEADAGSTQKIRTDLP